jgi:pepF/M3 family oligoendopeptidase
MSASLETTPPRWDLTTLFPSLDSQSFRDAFASVQLRIATLEKLPLNDYDTVTSALNATLDDVRTVRTYLSLLIAEDASSDAAQAKLSELRPDLVRLSLFSTRYTAWLGTLDADALRRDSEIARSHAFRLEQAQVAARHLMSDSEETLAGQLSLAGSAAWTRLHQDLTSQLQVCIGDETLPLPAVRQRASHPEESVRRLAYQAELRAWEQSALPLAAAMNAIKYETGLLSQKRGWSSPVEMACFSNHIDEATLHAMLGAAEKSFPDFRRYLKAKSRLLGTERLPWWNLFAPVGKTRQSWTWPEAEGFVAESFDAYSKSLGDFAREAFARRWIDAQLRPGKRDGAFCACTRAGESRILQNFSPSFDAVSTLAHELGHAYHNRCLSKRTPLQSGTPMALAETASIFCQTIVNDAALKRAEGVEERLALLEGALSDACQVVVDISSRYRFEQAVLEQRKSRELSVSELNALMLDCQEQTYGDGLSEEFRHPYMWAVKGHYYGSTFYNFPYMFGQLFALGLYAVYQAEPTGFHARYDTLLSQTGMADARTLAAGFGIDITQQSFWAASLQTIVKDIDRFESLTNEK